ncbi:hypothetical protein AAC387_Pa02g1375 [Persea americana]
MDKTWMNCRNKLRPEYKNGVRSFIKFANEHIGEQSKIWCPCLRCMNVELHTYPTVQEHLLFNGIMTSYTAWILHGEPMPMNVEGVHDDDSDDEGGSVQGGISNTEDNPHDELPELVEDIYRGFMDDDLGDLGSGHEIVTSGMLSEENSREDMVVDDDFICNDGGETLESCDEVEKYLHSIDDSVAKSDL